jgi:hypothetical protein
VFGFCIHERSDFHDRDAGEMMEYVQDLVATGDYPQLSTLAEGEGLDALWAHIQSHGLDPDRFDRNLARLLDGVERSLPN